MTYFTRNPCRHTPAYGNQNFAWLLSAFSLLFGLMFMHAGCVKPGDEHRSAVAGHGAAGFAHAFAFPVSYDSGNDHDHDHKPCCGRPCAAEPAILTAGHLPESPEPGRTPPAADRGGAAAWSARAMPGGDGRPPCGVPRLALCILRI